jgi:hypothetical protein
MVRPIDSSHNIPNIPKSVNPSRDLVATSEGAHAAYMDTVPTNAAAIKQSQMSTKNHKWSRKADPKTAKVASAILKKQPFTAQMAAVQKRHH